MAARISVSPGIQTVAVPLSISSRNQGCDYSSSPGFAILLNTCGVPPIVNMILVQVAAAVVDVVTGGLGLALEVPELVPGLNASILFSANQSAKIAKWGIR
jgi:hypothetical protein